MNLLAKLKEGQSCNPMFERVSQTLNACIRPLIVRPLIEQSKWPNNEMRLGSVTNGPMT